MCKHSCQPFKLLELIQCQNSSTVERLHECFPTGKTFAACLSKVQLEKLIWHQFSRANQLEVISPPLVFTQHAAHWLLLLIRSYFQPVESLCGAVDGPPRMHIPDSGWTICGAYVSSERGPWIVCPSIYGCWVLIEIVCHTQETLDFVFSQCFTQCECESELLWLNDYILGGVTE